jgi:cystathionine beta-lyase/cystathionine gamma-synthase
VPPIYQTTAFDIDDLHHLKRLADGEAEGYIYTRDGNPNQDAFATTIAQLEGAEAGFVSGSGMGSLSAVTLSHVKTGDHVIVAEMLYGRSVQLYRRLNTDFGVDVSFVDANNPAAFAEAKTDKTRLAFIESVSNPLLEVVDIQAIAAAIDDVPLLVDSTFSTPSLLRPIEHGATLVMHSASKYLSGHGDVTMGVVVGPEAIIKRSVETGSIFGNHAGPFECWLASRGVRTLPLRMERVSKTALKVAEFLSQHDHVSRVLYPGLKNHPTHDIAVRLLPRGFGGMLSFEINNGDFDTVSRFMRAAVDIPFSPTLADPATTISHPACTSHKALSPDERQRLGITDGLIRLSVGLEEPDQLIREIDEAIMAAKN